MMYAYLIHLSANMWRKKGQKSTNIKDEEDAIYHEEMCCDRETWRKITDFLPECGINTLLIDVGDGIQFDRHPEISIPGAWSKDKLKKELSVIWKDDGGQTITNADGMVVPGVTVTERPDVFKVEANAFCRLP